MTPPKLGKERREWLAGLKVGDEVAWVSDHFPTQIVRIVQIDGHFVVDDEPAKEGHCRATFTRLTGKERAGTFRPTSGWIVPPTDALRREHSVEVFSRYARDTSLTDEKILAIAAILWPEDFEGGK